jgi:rod shape-determining protein MreC
MGPFKVLKNISDLRILVLTFVIAVVFTFSFFSNFRLFIQNQLFAVGNGLWSINAMIFPEKTGLLKKIQEQESAISELAYSQVLLDKLKKENSELRETLNFTERLPDWRERLVMANVISVSSENSRQLMIVDKGIRHGMSVGQAVVSESGYLIGTVHQVNQFQSTIRLLQDTRSSLSVQILGRENSHGLLKGLDGSLLQLDFIPITTELEKSDIVITDSGNSKIPRGLVIGTIQEITVNPTNPFKQAIISPFTNNRRIRTIGIIR